ncbi:hypothetical protein [Streptomyces vastus]|uniref:hypothetical protein n=1 Tax=Streptomyces vastus TaxID=285451 RepID=UPI0031D0B3AE
MGHAAPGGRGLICGRVRIGGGDSGPERRAGSGTYSHPKERHQDGPLPVLQRRHRPLGLHHHPHLDEVLGLQFSYSYSSPAQLGDQKDAFERDVRRALTEFSPAGTFDELVRAEAIIATRP